MSLLKGWKITLMASMALASAGGQAYAQKPGSLDPSILGQSRPSMMPASYQLEGPAPDMAMGGAGPEMGPGGMMPGMDPSLPSVPCGPDGGYGGEGCTCGNCNDCDSYGRSIAGLFGAVRGRCASMRGILRPYGEGGIAAQRWFDFSAEAIALQRTRGASNVNLSSRGAGTNNFVLGTDNVDLDKMRAGLSVQANIQTGPGSNLEVVYFGLNRWSESASVNSTPNAAPDLYSFISAFGTVPVNGFDDSDRSLVHTLTYRSELHNGEINFRRRWAEPQGFFQGSFLAGIRYFDLDESARFTATGQNNNAAANNGARFFDYNVATRNSLVGFQIGSDLWYNLVPGIKLGVEGKTGIYNNRSHQDTNIFANSLPAFGIPPIVEGVLSNRTANITQLSAQGVYRLNYSWAFRGSYQFMYIDNVALAAENFNAAPPAVFLPNAVRNVSINNTADIVYQGFTLGGEYTW